MFCYDDDGKLVERQTTPALIRGLSGITQIVCGANHALALDNKGVLWTWGCADQNQLGRRITSRHTDSSLPSPSLTPQAVGIPDICYIATGLYHSFAVDKRGNVWGWGLNGFGQTGGDPTSAGRDGAPVLLPYPMKIKSLCGQGVVALDGGGHHSAAVTADGRCFVWGRLDDGQLGLDFTPEQLADSTLIRHDERGKPRICLRPVVVDKIGPAQHVACGTDHTIFVTRDGAVYSTGFNTQGQLGLGSDADVYVAQRVGGKAIQKRSITWSGCGGQFSAVAGPHVAQKE